MKTSRLEAEATSIVENPIMLLLRTDFVSLIRTFPRHCDIFCQQQESQPLARSAFRDMHRVQVSQANKPSDLSGFKSAQNDHDHGVSNWNILEGVIPITE